jgi:hypothetical protein
VITGRQLELVLTDRRVHRAARLPSYCRTWRDCWC